MRSLRALLAGVGLLGFVPVGLAAPPAPKDLLKFRPTQAGVEYETPTEPAAIDACKVESVVNAQKKSIGYALRDGQGKLLRRFVDNNGNGVLDQWSYFQDGFEVYRESDLNNDKSLDECRWLNTAGTRTASVAGSKITAWKRISAEEASKVFVQALVTSDLGLLETVLATPEELTSLGVPKGEIDQVAKAAEHRTEQVKALAKALIGWNRETVWNRLDGMMPHLIPADPATGLAHDLTLYENAVIFAGPASGQVNATKIAFLQVPEMVKIGETWKFVELPRAVDPEKPIVASEGGIRSWIVRQSDGTKSQDPELEAALKALADFDEANSKLQARGDKKDFAQFHVGRIPLLRDLVKKAKNPEDQLSYNKQIVDSLAAAFQTGLYPKGLTLLNSLMAEGGKIGSYAAFRKIAADFAAQNDEGNSNVMANQKKWMADLKGFLKDFPQADEAADALFQLASASEFNADEDEARKFYAQLAQDFPASDPGKKAAGALKRFDLVGKSLELKGAGPRSHESIDAASYRGKVLLIDFWATWAEPVKRDLPELTRVYEKHRKDGFEVIGVNLDNDRAELEKFLKDNPLPWPQIVEEKGMEGRLATEFGIISLPTMILVDAEGKVVNRNLRTAAELERQLDKVLPAKQAGVALDAK